VTVEAPQLGRAALRAIMARAEPPMYRRPPLADRWDGFLRILRAFFASTDLRTARVLDIGPGHYQFSTLVAAAGGRPIAVERDAALAELGRALGHQVVEKDAFAVTAGDLGGPVDGLFSKYSLRTFEHRTPERARAACDRIDALLAPDGWGWVAPWSGGVTRHTPGHMRSIAGALAERFQERGWEHFQLDEEQARLFHLKGGTPTYDRPLFTKRLRLRRAADPSWSLATLAHSAAFQRGACVVWDGVEVLEPPWSRAELQNAIEVLLGFSRLRGRILNIGPCLYDLEDVCRARGDCTMWSVERDPAMAAARRRSYRVLETDVGGIATEDVGGPVDGLLSMGFTDANGARDVAEVGAACANIDALIVPGGWGLIVLRESPTAADPGLLQHQRRCFGELGWSHHGLPPHQAAKLGLRGHAQRWSVHARGIGDLGVRISGLGAA
jgi:hypothetical protein